MTKKSVRFSKPWSLGKFLLVETLKRLENLETPVVFFEGGFLIADSKSTQVFMWGL